MSCNIMLCYVVFTLCYLNGILYYIILYHLVSRIISHYIDGLRKTGDAPGHKPRLLLLVVLRILVVVVVVGS